MQINTKRVLSLIKRDWILHKRYFYVGILALVSICIFVMFLFISDGDMYLPHGVSEIIFSVMLFSVGSIYTLRSFREFNRQSDAVTYLSIPASHMEKFLSRWIITFPIFFIVCSIVFVICYSLFSIVAEQIWDAIFIPFASFRFVYFLEILASYFFTHSVFLLLALCFTKNTIAKSMMIFVLFWFLFAIFSYYINNGSVQADDSFKALLTSSYRYLMFLAVPIFWYLSYRRLKAKTA